MFGFYGSRSVSWFPKIRVTVDFMLTFRFLSNIISISHLRIRRLKSPSTYLYFHCNIAFCRLQHTRCF
jgi:hypothetical protein